MWPIRTLSLWDYTENFIALHRLAGKFSSLLKKSFFPDCSKMARCKAPEILRSEAYLDVRRNDEG